MAQYLNGMKGNRKHGDPKMALHKNGESNGRTLELTVGHFARELNVRLGYVRELMNSGVLSVENGTLVKRRGKTYVNVQRWLELYGKRPAEKRDS